MTTISSNIGKLYIILKAKTILYIIVEKSKSNQLQLKYTTIYTA